MQQALIAIIFYKQPWPLTNESCCALALAQGTGATAIFKASSAIGGVPA